MTIREYATSRGVSYDIGYRAVKRAFKDYGIKMERGAAGNQIAAEHLDAIDKHLAGRPKQGEARRGSVGIAEQIKATRDSWLQPWMIALSRFGKNSSSVEKFQVATVVGFISVWPNEGVFNKETVALLLRIVKELPFDRFLVNGEVKASGFTKYLEESEW